MINHLIFAVGIVCVALVIYKLVTYKPTIPPQQIDAKKMHDIFVELSVLLSGKDEKYLSSEYLSDAVKEKLRAKMVTFLPVKSIIHQEVEQKGVEFVKSIFYVALFHTQKYGRVSLTFTKFGGKVVDIDDMMSSRT